MSALPNSPRSQSPAPTATTAKSPTIGFLGTGAITEAMVHGLCRHAKFSGSILISERNLERSSQLAKTYPNVTASSNNQDLLEQAHWIFIAVLPAQTEDLIKPLRFDANHLILSLAGGISVASLQEWAAPATKIHRLIPMPPVENGVGPIPIFPSHKEVEELLAAVGTVIPIEEERHFTTLSASSAAMATFFEMQASIARWTEGRGVAPEAAARYTATLFEALSTIPPELDATGLQDLSEECLTAGGLNESVLRAVQKDGWFENLERRLEEIAQRLDRSVS